MEILAMGHHLFLNKDKCIVYNAMDNAENVNPYNYFLEYNQRRIYNRLRGFTNLESEFLKRTAFKVAVRQLETMKTIAIPKEILEIIEKPLNKKEQIAILKGGKISASQLGSIFLYAGTQGYTFSNYRIEQKVKNIKEEDLPGLIVVNDDKSVECYGETKLKDGEMRGIVNQKKSLIARIIDNGEMWHWFYQTTTGVYGQERGDRGGQPHIHYWSSAFGLKKEQVVQKIKAFEMPSSEVHLDFEYK